MSAGKFDTSRPNVARVCDVLLGGKDNFAADRELAERLLEICPSLRHVVRGNRAGRGRDEVTARCNTGTHGRQTPAS
jgi:hypothetical protein